MLLLLAVLAAILWLPTPWNAIVVVAAAIVEGLEVWFWVWWTRRREPVTGPEALLGAVALATTPLDPDGQVRVGGELWQARSDVPARSGDRVVIHGVEPDLTLVVTPEQGKSPQ